MYCLKLRKIRRQERFKQPDVSEYRLEGDRRL